MSDEDNRKRGYQQEDEIGAALSSKRAALGLAEQAATHYDAHQSAPEEHLYFKLLCPQSIVGIIIGKGGANMSNLIATTGAKIKLSQNGDFFPGTGERVILLNGSKESMSSALRELVMKIAEANERKGEPVQDRRHVPANRGPDGSFQIRLLIPHSSAGVLIGKGGAIIKQMIDKTHCKMQMGEEADPFQTNERMFVLNAPSIHALAAGAVEVMGVLHSQPKHRNYVNTTASYAPPPPPGAPGPGNGHARPPAPMPPHYAPPGTAAPVPAPVPTMVMGPGGVPMQVMSMPTPGYPAPQMAAGPRGVVAPAPAPYLAAQGGHVAQIPSYSVGPAAPPPQAPNASMQVQQMSAAPQYPYPGQPMVMPQQQQQPQLMQQGYSAMPTPAANAQQMGYAPRPGAPAAFRGANTAAGMAMGQAVGTTPTMSATAPGMVMYAAYPAANGAMQYGASQYPSLQQQQYAATPLLQQGIVGGQYAASYQQPQMMPQAVPQQMQQQQVGAAGMGQPYMAQGYVQQQPQQGYSMQQQGQQQYSAQYPSQYRSPNGR